MSLGKLIGYLIAIILIFTGVFALAKDPRISNQISQGLGGFLFSLGWVIGILIFNAE